MSAGLRVESLSAAYGAATVLHEVSLAVAPGKTLGLVGESGCGKTTLGYLLGGDIAAGGRVLGGRVELDGVDVLALSGAALRRWRSRAVAFVHQDAGAALDPTMRVGDQVRAALRAAGPARAATADAASALLRRVRLPDVDVLAQRYPHQLSGGQQQRVVIACALAARPRLLVLDEPTTALDASVRHEVLALLAELRDELDAAVVLVSHDLALVGRWCDTVAVLYAGRVVETGPARAVLDTPAHPYTAALLAAAPRFGETRRDRRLPSLPGTAPAPGRAGPGCAFAPRCAFATSVCRPTEPALEGGPGRGRRVRCRHPLDARPPERPLLAPPAPPAERPPVRLELRGLVRRYGTTTAVDHVDLTLGRGEVLGLVGESGSGKTTLARAAVGLAASGPGETRLDGAVVPAALRHRDRATRRELQMVFQNPDTSLNPRHRVRRILDRALRTLGVRGTGPSALAARVGLGEQHLDARPDQLSGGQKQRVAIARGLAGAPAVLVCDEAVSALDVSVQAGVLELVAEEARRGTAALFVSHDLAVVGHLADRIAVMYRGAVVEEGPALDVLRGPHHPYTAVLVAASLGRPEPPGPGAAGTAGCRFADRCRYAEPGRCDTAPPPQREPHPGHRVACVREPDRLPVWSPEPVRPEPGGA